MLLIRSLGQEQYARQINQGVVGCRDLLSHLFCKTDNKYPYADFYEALFSQVRRRFHSPVLAIHGLSDWQMQLVTFLLDPLVADTYMTFFHIADAEKTERWLDSLDDGHFIFIDPHFAVDETICGKNETAYYCGSRLRYVEKAEDINVRETNMACPGIATVFADSETYGCCPDINERTIYAFDLMASFTPLMNRILGPGTSETENEFRYLIRRKRRYYGRGLYSPSLNTSTLISCDGVTYKVQIRTWKSSQIRGMLDFSITLIPCDSQSKQLDLITAMQNGSDINVVPHFYNLNITGTSNRWGYIGNKDKCKRFIEKELKRGVRHRKDRDYHTHHGEWDRLIAVRKMDDSYSDGDGVILRSPEYGAYEMKQGQRVLNDKDLPAE